MRNMRYAALVAALVLLSACGNNDFYDAYSVMEVGNVKPIPLDD